MWAGGSPLIPNIKDKTLRYAQNDTRSERSEESLLPELVREVNRDVLAETDFLSDTVYRYDGETRELSMINPPEWMREKDSPEMDEPGLDGPKMSGPEMGSPEPEQSLPNKKMSM